MEGAREAADRNDFLNPGSTVNTTIATAIDAKEKLMSSSDNLERTVLPIPAQPRTGLILYDAKDPENKYPPITPLRPPAGAPNVLLVLIDDAGFGSSSEIGRAHV